MTNEKEEHSWGGKVSSKTVALAPLPSMPQSGPSEPVVIGASVGKQIVAFREGYAFLD